MKENLDTMKPCYSKQILPFTWPFVIIYRGSTVNEILFSKIFRKGCILKGMLIMDLRFLHRMPNCIFLHFEEGLQHPGFEDLELNAEDGHYVMTQFIQYKKNPDHFVCWTKEPQGIN